MGIRINELPATTTVLYLFFSNTNMVSTGDKTQVNLTQIQSGLETGWMRTKPADTAAEVSKAKVFTRFIFPHFQADCFSVCLRWEPDSIPSH